MCHANRLAKETFDSTPYTLLFKVIVHSADISESVEVSGNWEEMAEFLSAWLLCKKKNTINKGNHT